MERVLFRKEKKKKVESCCGRVVRGWRQKNEARMAGV
jgi:hypothetical protein